jgi:hypothetical protein
MIGIKNLHASHYSSAWDGKFHQKLSPIDQAANPFGWY